MSEISNGPDEMSEIKLLPCPFCDGEALINEVLDNDKMYQVMCPRCFCKTTAFATKKSAVITWNTRKPMERIIERLEELKNAPKVESCYNNGWETSAECSIHIVKEEGGFNA